MNILITGAASGIARAVIQRLLSKDVFLYVAVHTEKQLELAEKRYQEYTNVKCIKLDVTCKEDRELVKEYDIDVFISNAAMGVGGSIAEIDMDLVRDNFEVNVFSNFLLLQDILAKMMKKGKGRIIMMSSLAAYVPLPFLGSYSATKASIKSLTKALQMEMGYIETDIDVVLIEPGLYKTGFNKVMLDNKYDWMEKDSYFKEELDVIRSRENLILSLFEKKNLNTIAKKIENSVFSRNPQKTYVAPFLSKVAIKVYTLFFQ